MRKWISLAVAATVLSTPVAAAAEDWHQLAQVVGTAPDRKILLIDRASVRAEGDQRLFRYAQLFEKAPPGLAEGFGWFLLDGAIDCRARTSRTSLLQAFATDGTSQFEEDVSQEPAMPLRPGSPQDGLRAAVCDNDWTRLAKAESRPLGELRRRLFQARP